MTPIQAGGAFQDANEVELRRAERRHGAERQRGADHDKHEKREHAPIHREVQLDRERHGHLRDGSHERLRQHVRDRRATGGARARQQQVLCQQLTNQPPAAGAHRLTNGQLDPPRRRACQHEIGHVDADDHQDQPDDDRQDTGENADRDCDLRVQHHRGIDGHRSIGIGGVPAGGAQAPSDGVEIRFGIHSTGVRLEAAQHVHGQALGSRRRIQRRAEHRVGTQGYPEIRHKRRHRAGKTRLGHPHDSERVIVQRDGATHDIARSGKPALPEPVRQHRDGRRARAIVRLIEQTAVTGFHAEQWEIVAADHLAVRVLDLAIESIAGRYHLKCRKPLERRVPVSQGLVGSLAGVREVVRVRADDTRRVGHRQQAEEIRVRHGEDRGVDADPEREHEHGNRREPRGAAERAHPVADVLHETLDAAVLPHVGRRIAQRRHVAELAARLPLRLRGRHATRDEPRFAHLHVRAHLFVHAGAHPAPPEELSRAGPGVDDDLGQPCPEPVEGPAHATSGSITRSMALTRRRQFVTSIPACLRPRGVSS